MTNTETPPAITEDLVTVLEATIDRAIKGIRDPERMDQAAKEMDEAREEVFQRLGELDLAAELTDRDE